MHVLSFIFAFGFVALFVVLISQPSDLTASDLPQLWPAAGDAPRHDSVQKTRPAQTLAADRPQVFPVAGSLQQFCDTCHHDEDVLSPTHPPTSATGLAACQSCHIKGASSDLADKLPLSHAHLLSGVSCAGCHGSSEPMDEPATETCLACHGPLQRLSALTSEAQPTNPHDSPHGWPYADCALCHGVHKTSENFCATCHDFDFHLPWSK